MCRIVVLLPLATAALAAVIALPTAPVLAGDEADPAPAEPEAERLIVVPGIEPVAATEAPTVGTSIRIGGSPLGDLLAGGGSEFRAGDCLVDTPLPEGYPPPTVPGGVELKTYPVVRRAEVSGRSAPDFASNFAFFRLFRHIQRREIAMTSPVEMDYRIEETPTTPTPGDELDWTMSFLYRTRDLGPTGKDGNVEVIDRPETTVLSIGLRGGYGAREVFSRLEELRAWVERLPGWEIAGPPRGFFYNGPNIPAGRRWGEAQIPVRRVPPATEASPEGDEPAEAAVPEENASSERPSPG